MNPDTNKLEMLNHLSAIDGLTSQLVRPDGSPVPKHWTIFKVGENLVVSNYTFRVAYINEGCLMLEPVGPLIVTPED